MMEFNNRAGMSGEPFFAGHPARHNNFAEQSYQGESVEPANNTTSSEMISMMHGIGYNNGVNDNNNSNISNGAPIPIANAASVRSGGSPSTMQSPGSHPSVSHLPSFHAIAIGDHGHAKNPDIGNGKANHSIQNSLKLHSRQNAEVMAAGGIATNNENNTSVLSSSFPSAGNIFLDLNSRSRPSAQAMFHNQPSTQYPDISSQGNWNAAGSPGDTARSNNQNIYNFGSVHPGSGQVYPLLKSAAIHSSTQAQISVGGYTTIDNTQPNQHHLSHNNPVLRPLHISNQGQVTSTMQLQGSDIQIDHANAANQLGMCSMPSHPTMVGSSVSAHQYASYSTTQSPIIEPYQSVCMDVPYNNTSQGLAAAEAMSGTAAEAETMSAQIYPVSQPGRPPIGTALADLSAYTSGSHSPYVSRSRSRRRAHNAYHYESHQTGTTPYSSRSSPAHEAYVPPVPKIIPTSASQSFEPTAAGAATTIVASGYNPLSLSTKVSTESIYQYPEMPQSPGVVTSISASLQPDQPLSASSYSASNPFAHQAGTGGSSSSVSATSYPYRGMGLQQHEFGTTGYIQKSRMSSFSSENSSSVAPAEHRTRIDSNTNAAIVNSSDMDIADINDHGNTDTLNGSGSSGNASVNNSRGGYAQFSTPTSQAQLIMDDSYRSYVPAAASMAHMRWNAVSKSSPLRTEIDGSDSGANNTVLIGAAQSYSDSNTYMQTQSRSRPSNLISRIVSSKGGTPGSQTCVPPPHPGYAAVQYDSSNNISNNGIDSNRPTIPMPSLQSSPHLTYTTNNQPSLGTLLGDDSANRSSGTLNENTRDITSLHESVRLDSRTHTAQTSETNIATNSNQPTPELHINTNLSPASNMHRRSIIEYNSQEPQDERRNNDEQQSANGENIPSALDGYYTITSPSEIHSAIAPSSNTDISSLLPMAEVNQMLQRPPTSNMDEINAHSQEYLHRRRRRLTQSIHQRQRSISSVDPTARVTTSRYTIPNPSPGTNSHDSNHSTEEIHSHDAEYPAQKVSYTNQQNHKSPAASIPYLVINTTHGPATSVTASVPAAADYDFDTLPIHQRAQDYRQLQTQVSMQIQSQVPNHLQYQLPAQHHQPHQQQIQALGQSATQSQIEYMRRLQQEQLQQAIEQKRLEQKLAREHEIARFQNFRPIIKLTVDLVDTYRKCRADFQYESARRPRRVLTKPSEGVKNDGFDNENSDYILYVNDVIGDQADHEYMIIEMLGSGTFGQVVKCQNLATGELVAVKVIKNKTAYYNQSMMEVQMLNLLNNKHDREDKHHILRLKEWFVFRNHLVFVNELLSLNLYDLLKQNQYHGLSTNLVRILVQQILDSMSVLADAQIIHADLKPENILLKGVEKPEIKVIDFGSACFEWQTTFTYIQSRFYRSPEILLGLPYSSRIDMWSLGCIVAELYLGLPLFPGSSEYNQLSRIIDLLGLPPSYMLEKARRADEFFNYIGPNIWEFKSIDQYSRERKVEEKPSKRYFNARTLEELITTYPIRRKVSEIEQIREAQSRVALIDFLRGLLQIDPDRRWSPQQAILHPFITGEPFSGSFVPPNSVSDPHDPGNTPSSYDSQAGGYNGHPAPGGDDYYLQGGGGQMSNMHDAGYYGQGDIGSGSGNVNGTSYSLNNTNGHSQQKSVNEKASDTQELPLYNNFGLVPPLPSASEHANPILEPHQQSQLHATPNGTATSSLALSGASPSIPGSFPAIHSTNNTQQWLRSSESANQIQAQVQAQAQAQAQPGHNLTQSVRRNSSRRLRARTIGYSSGLTRSQLRGGNGSGSLDKTPMPMMSNEIPQMNNMLAEQQYNSNSYNLPVNSSTVGYHFLAHDPSAALYQAGNDSLAPSNKREAVPGHHYYSSYNSYNAVDYPAVQAEEYPSLRINRQNVADRQQPTERSSQRPPLPIRQSRQLKNQQRMIVNSNVDSSRLSNSVIGTEYLNSSEDTPFLVPLPFVDQSGGGTTLIESGESASGSRGSIIGNGLSRISPLSSEAPPSNGGTLEGSANAHNNEPSSSQDSSPTDSSPAPENTQRSMATEYCATNGTYDYGDDRNSPMLLQYTSTNESKVESPTESLAASTSSNSNGYDARSELVSSSEATNAGYGTCIGHELSPLSLSSARSAKPPAYEWVSLGTHTRPVTSTINSSSNDEAEARWSYAPHSRIDGIALANNAGDAEGPDTDSDSSRESSPVTQASDSDDGSAYENIFNDDYDNRSELWNKRFPSSTSTSTWRSADDALINSNDESYSNSNGNGSNSINLNDSNGDVGSSLSILPRTESRKNGHQRGTVNNYSGSLSFTGTSCETVSVISQEDLSGCDELQDEVFEDAALALDRLEINDGVNRNGVSDMSSEISDIDPGTMGVSDLAVALNSSNSTHASSVRRPQSSVFDEEADAEQQEQDMVVFSGKLRPAFAVQHNSALPQRRWSSGFVLRSGEGDGSGTSGSMPDALRQLDLLVHNAHRHNTTGQLGQSHQGSSYLSDEQTAAQCEQNGVQAQITHKDSMQMFESLRRMGKLSKNEECRLHNTPGVGKGGNTMGSGGGGGVSRRGRYKEKANEFFMDPVIVSMSPRLMPRPWK